MSTKKYVSLDKLSLYNEKIKKVISDGDAATLAAANAAAEALGSNYDAAGSAATAEENANAHADSQFEEAARLIGEVEVKADQGISEAESANANAIDAHNRIDTLETYVGTIPDTATATDIVGYIQEKTAGIATDTALEELTGRVAQAETDIGNIEKDYLKAADKTELEGEIGAVQTAVDTEKSRAEGIEAGLRTDVDAIKGDYLKSSDKTELQGNIDTVSAAVERLTNGVSAEEIDGVNDLIQYVKDHGTEVTGMQEDISDNADAIAGVAGRMDTAEGKITTLEGAVATKAEQTALDEAVDALEGADAGQVERIAALEAKFGEGEGTVEDLIADAKQEAIDTAAGDATTKANTAEGNAKGYTDTEIDKVEATIATMQTAIDGKAAASDLTALTGRVATAEGEIETIKTVVVEVKNKADSNELAINLLSTAVDKKASQSDLTAATDRITAIETWHSNFVEVSEEEINNLFA